MLAPEAVVYLGMKNRPDPGRFERDLRAAQDGGPPFPVTDHVNAWPARKHDHFSIPAGTVHCSGKGNIVLEISATPYIFTFKLWDWARLGLDGRPRPIHLEHGLANIQWDRTTDWVAENLVSPIRAVASRRRVPRRIDRTPHVGVHRDAPPLVHRAGRPPYPRNVNVLNLVEGDAAMVESPGGAFDPFVVHYAETFVVPAAVGPYRIRPLEPASEQPVATIKAFVRDTASAAR